MSNLAFLEVTWLETKNIAASVQYVEVEDNDRLTDKATIVLQDPEKIGMNTIERAQTIRIDLGWQEEHAVLFDGIITRVDGHAQGNGKNVVTITALDKSALMHVEAKNRDHTGTLSSIIKQIVAAYPIPVGQIEPSPDTEYKDKPLRQVNQTDLQFIQQLAAQSASRAFVEYNEGQSKFYFIPEKRLLTGEKMGEIDACFGSHVIEFKYKKVSSMTPAVQTTATHDPVTGAVVASTPVIPTPTPPIAADSKVSESAGQVSATRAAVYEGAVEAAGTAPSADTLTRKNFVAGVPSDKQLPDSLVQQDQTAKLGLQGEGAVIGTIKLRAKGMMTINGIASWAAGDWYVKVAKHVFQGGPDPKKATYQTKFTVTR